MNRPVHWANRVVLLCAILCGLFGGLLWGRELYLVCKAKYASVLIERAYQRHLQDAGTHKPWGWADMNPIAKLHVPRLNQSQTVLAGAAGNSLAFGPGWVHGTSIPNTAGRSVLTGHRDTNFKFLERLKIDDRIIVETIAGEVIYQVEAFHIVDEEEGELSLWNSGRSLALVTCYPFDTTKDHGLRYIVIANEPQS